MNEQVLLIRLVWALAIIAGGLALYWLANRLILYRAQNNGAASSTKPLLTHPGTPAILYFTTPGCTVCKTVQRPALQHLQERLGERMQIVEVDAQEQPEMASQWGVLSVPTTFIIDGEGQIRHVNHGVTRADKLLQQVGAIRTDGR